MKDDFDVDFVIPWVDGSDPEWIREFNKYVPDDRQIDARNIRYRDFGLLKYWFRGVEKFAPWVNKIHFITCGQKPTWLNSENPKLHFVKHSDYIPKDCLPTFSARPINLYIHKISDLTEHFVYFDDDFYLTGKVEKRFFFKKGLPCDSAIMEIKTSGEIPMLNVNFNNLNLINASFDKRQVIAKHFFKWFNLRYGKWNLHNLLLSFFPKFSGFINPHMPQAYLKSTIEDVWLHCPEKLTETMHSRFRGPFDVNQWLFRHWALCKGDFFPMNPLKGRKCFDLTDENAAEIALAIQSSKYKQIVINDSELQDFDLVRQILQAAFDKLLPDKSSFEA